MKIEIEGLKRRVERESQKLKQRKEHLKSLFKRRFNVVRLLKKRVKSDL